jgi:DNA-binding FadR family transcriptional regulator
MSEKPAARQSLKAATALAVSADEAPVPLFQPVRTRRAFEAVCDQIRQQIARGDLRPGDRLPGERDLTEQFGISRVAVREALRSLEAAGVVQARTGLNGGFFIRTDSNSTGITQTVQDMVALGQISIANVTEARVELMGVALRLACARATEAELDAIEADIEHHTALFSAGGGSRNSKSVIEFYRLIARATHNEVIVLMVDALSEIIRALLANIEPQPRKDIMQVRQQVLTLLRRRDAEGAVEAMALHLRRVNDYLESESGKAKVKSTLTA